MFHSRRIAIVGGGGSGITAAWLLDPCHDVTLFEAAPSLGGHAHTVSVEIDGLTCPVDDGAAWFSDPLYPHMLRLLELVGASTRRVGMSWGFEDTTRDTTPLNLPPHGVLGAFQLLAKGAWWSDLVRLDNALRAAEPLVAERKTDWRWTDFVAHHRLSPRFAAKVLTPIVAGAWGAPADRIAEMSAYTLLKYMVLHRPSTLAPFSWHVLRGGVANYVERVASHLTRAVVHRGTPVTALRRDALGWIVSTEGQEARFDEVVLAVGAGVAQRLLKGVAGVERLAAHVGAVETYRTRVATHSDVRHMPRRRSDWNVANLRFDGQNSRMTIWSGHPWGLPVFTTPIGEGPLPARTHHVSTFELPLLTPDHHRGQRALGGLQGEAGLHIAGDWTRDIGSHEDAVDSAIAVCERMAPHSPNLARLRLPRVTRFGAPIGNPEGVAA